MAPSRGQLAGCMQGMQGHLRPRSPVLRQHRKRLKPAADSQNCKEPQARSRSPGPVRHQRGSRREPVQPVPQTQQRSSNGSGWNPVRPEFKPDAAVFDPAALEAAGPGDAAEPLERKDFGKFVSFFRQASPYIEGHRDRTFVIVVPGEVVLYKHLLQSVLQDVTLLHGLGSRLVLVLGATTQIDNYLCMRGLESVFVGGYRVTDETAMLAAMEAAGTSRMLVEAYLSKAPAVPMIRRHTRSSNHTDEFHFAPTIRVVSGNYVTGKRRGVIEGVDFCSTGKVRFVQRDAIQRQLELGHIALLSNLAYSAAGEILNCNTFDVATHAAIELQADKLFCLSMDEVSHLNLPQWLPVSDAEALITHHLSNKSFDSNDDMPAGACSVPFGVAPPSSNGIDNGAMVDRSSVSTPQSGGAVNMGMSSRDAAPTGSPRDVQRTILREIELDLDCWQALDFPSSVLACLVACKNGVKRAHLVDARQDGGLLLELYSRDGVGTMISADFYEGIRSAQPQDLEAIEALLKPLEREGIVRPRSRNQLMQELHNFTVLERESKVLACVLLGDLGVSPDGFRCGELAAFCVHPSYRGSGRGDSLLDYVEQSTRSRGIQRLVLLTTRSADWFEQRDFLPAGIAHESQLLPEDRRTRIDPARGSKLYVKDIVELKDTVQAAPAGKRIGF